MLAVNTEKKRKELSMIQSLANVSGRKTKTFRIILFVFGHLLIMKISTTQTCKFQHTHFNFNG